MIRRKPKPPTPEFNTVAYWNDSASLWIRNARLYLGVGIGNAALGWVLSYTNSETFWGLVPQFFVVFYCGYRWGCCRRMADDAKMNAWKLETSAVLQGMVNSGVHGPEDFLAFMKDMRPPWIPEKEWKPSVTIEGPDGEIESGPQ